MNTIALPIKTEITDFLKSFNPIVRFSYNRFQDGWDEKQIRHHLKDGFFNYNNQLLDSWFVQCAIKEGKSWFSKFEESGHNIIFGGKKNLKDFQDGKISKSEWKQFRLHPISSIGQKNCKGNRKFTLDILENNQIIFKASKNNHIIIKLPKLRKNYKEKLIQLEQLSKMKQITFSVRLSNTSISITYDESALFSYNSDWNSNRVISIDTNPNYLGYSILEFENSDSDEFKILDHGYFSVENLTTALKLKSDDPIQIQQNNKRNYEIFQINKFLIEKSIHYKCHKFIVEDLLIKSKNHKKGKKFNRLVNNIWNRSMMFTNLQKHCNIFNINFVKVNCAYSSFVGNVNYGNDFPDPICAAIEIGRRGFHKYVKGKFYPKFIVPEYFSNRWKDLLNVSYENWIEFYQHIVKTLKLRYRSSSKSFELEVCSLLSIKSDVNLYKLIDFNT